MSNRTLTSEQINAAKRLKIAFNDRKQELSLTQQKVADLMGVTQGAVYQWLNAKTPIGYKALISFSKILAVDPNKLFPELCEEFEGHLSQVMERSGDYKIDPKTQKVKPRRSKTRQQLDELTGNLAEKDLKTLLSVAQGLAAKQKTR